MPSEEMIREQLQREIEDLRERVSRLESEKEDLESALEVANGKLGAVHEELLLIANELKHKDCKPVVP